MKGEEHYHGERINDVEKKSSSGILERIQSGIMLLDGAMGTELMKGGLLPGSSPEVWNVEKPEWIQEVHRGYFQAGSDAVLTNSFGGNPIKLDAHGLGDRCHELNRQAALLAVAVRPEKGFVGGSLGPTGRFLEPQGTHTEMDFESAYALQAEALSSGGVDFLLIETQYDLREALCAVRGVHRSCDLPVFVTMTFNRTPRGFFTIMGNSVEASFKALENLAVQVVGANCTLDSNEMAELTGIMRQFTDHPLLVQANAGRPELTPEGNVIYAQGVEDYVQYIPKMITAGADVIGGCCGTDAEYIRRMSEIIKTYRD